jgi:hypothetical protein
MITKRFQIPKGYKQSLKLMRKKEIDYYDKGKNECTSCVI